MITSNLADCSQSEMYIMNLPPSSDHLRLFRIEKATKHIMSAAEKCAGIYFEKPELRKFFNRGTPTWPRRGRLAGRVGMM